MSDEREMELLLESVAREIVQQPLGFAHPITTDVLKRRLLPLLEAGRMYRELHAAQTRNWRARAYDEAKHVALEGAE